MNKKLNQAKANLIKSAEELNNISIEKGIYKTRK